MSSRGSGLYKTEVYLTPVLDWIPDPISKKNKSQPPHREYMVEDKINQIPEGKRSLYEDKRPSGKGVLDYISFNLLRSLPFYPTDFISAKQKFTLICKEWVFLDDRPYCVAELVSEDKPLPENVINIRKYSQNPQFADDLTTAFRKIREYRRRFPRISVMPRCTGDTPDLEMGGNVYATYLEIRD